MINPVDTLTEAELKSRFIYMGDAYAMQEGQHLSIKGPGRPAFTVKKEFKEKLAALCLLEPKAPDVPTP